MKKALLIFGVISALGKSLNAQVYTVSDFVDCINDLSGYIQFESPNKYHINKFGCSLQNNTITFTVDETIFTQGNYAKRFFTTYTFDKRDLSTETYYSTNPIPQNFTVTVNTKSNKKLIRYFQYEYDNAQRVRSVNENINNRITVAFKSEDAARKFIQVIEQAFRQ